MTLHINTTDLTKVVFTLTEGRKVFAQYTQEMPPHSTHQTLQHLESFLNDQGWSMDKKPKEVQKIALYKQEGSPTGLRLGGAISQGLSLAWGIPISLTDIAY